MTWDPDSMTYGEMERARDSANLCRSCRHREVCPVPAEMVAREGWFLSVATCAHHEPDAADVTVWKKVGVVGSNGQLEHICEGVDGAQSLPPLSLRWMMLWAEVMAAHARALLDEAERTKSTAAAEIRVAVQQAERALSSARRTWKREVDGEC
jgi:hypothetical protein